MMTWYKRFLDIVGLTLTWAYDNSNTWAGKSKTIDLYVFDIYLTVVQTLFEIYLTRRRNFKILLALEVISSGFAGGHHSQYNLYLEFGICIWYFVIIHVTVMA